jgi:hypothetical protein
MSNQLTSKTRIPYLSMHLQTTVQGSNNPLSLHSCSSLFFHTSKVWPCYSCVLLKPCFASINEARDPTTFTFSREYLTRYHSHLQKPQPTICLGVFDQCLFHYTQLPIRSMTHLDYRLNLPPGFLKRIFLWASKFSFWSGDVAAVLHCIELSGIYRCSCSVHMLKIRCLCNIRSG